MAPPRSVFEDSLQWRAGLLPGRTSPWDTARGNSSHPSMEGRAIARPNSDYGVLDRWLLPPFNGGPGYCPAEQAFVRFASASCFCLQWRAGLLPGRTTSGSGGAAHTHGLQWRAGLLPGRTGGGHETMTTGEIPSMEGRAIARPNRTTALPTRPSSVHLQWRAGLLPGRTRCALGWPHAQHNSFNGGPGYCPAEPPLVNPLA